MFNGTADDDEDSRDEGNDDWVTCQDFSVLAKHST